MTKLNRLFSILRGLLKDNPEININGVCIQITKERDIVIKGYRALQTQGDVIFLNYADEELDKMNYYKVNLEELNKINDSASLENGGYSNRVQPILPSTGCDIRRNNDSLDREQASCGNG